MENPLLKYMGVEEREDGLYVKIMRNTRERCSKEIIEKAIREAFVMNCNFEKLQDVYMRARGIFEKLGDNFEYFNILFDNYITINVTPLSAKMKISSNAVAAELKPSMNIFKYALNKKGIIYGIKDDVLREIAANGKYDKEFEVAQGIAPEPGKDGVVHLEIELDHDSTPTVDPFGKTNFRDITTFTTVKNGQTLAKCIPPKKGRSGKSILGSEIESVQGVAVTLPAGKNTKITEDGQTLIATRDGIVYEYGNNICIEEILDIPKDVDYSVGNLKYSGDIFIKGNVLPGFVVEADGDISILGDVESAKIISRNGFVTIGKGIIGKENTYIYGKKGVQVGFAQDVKIQTDGVLTVEKHLLHSDCVCQKMESENHTASVIGGKLVAFESISIANLGNDGGIDTNIFVRDKQKVEFEEKVKELIIVRQKLEKQMFPISKELKTKTALLKKFSGKASDRQKLELKKWIDAYNDLTMKIKYIDEKISDIKDKMNDPSRYNGYIKVAGTIHKGVVLHLYDISNKKINDTIKNKIFRLKDQAIYFED